MDYVFNLIVLKTIPFKGETRRFRRLYCYICIACVAMGAPDDREARVFFIEGCNQYFGPKPSPVEQEQYYHEHIQRYHILLSDKIFMANKTRPRRDEEQCSI